MQLIRLISALLCTALLATPAIALEQGKGRGQAKQDQGKHKGHVNKPNKTTPATNVRFDGLDRNGDGIITRAEWRGDNQSFLVHDVNRDGVLSGVEIRAGAKRRPR